MKIEIKDIINRHKGTPAIICGFGPSLDIVRPLLPSYKDRGYKILSCNNWFNFIPSIDYWIMASNVDTIGDFLNDINVFKIPVFYADSVDLTRRNLLDQIQSEILPYDQRHFGNQICLEGYRKCCEHIIPKRLTIQEELKQHSGWSEKYSTGHTVASHMIAFAILMGCNPIYVAGIDLDYRLGYAKNRGDQVPYDPDEALKNYRTATLNDFRILDESAKQLQIKIINTNVKAAYDTFRKGDIE